jgi:hypothetical protein
MSYDLFIFEKIKTFRTSIDVKYYLEVFIEDDGEVDYNSLDGCSPKVVEFAKEMFEKFPPLNGPYAPPDDIAFASEESESHLTDYSLYEYGVYCSFAWSVAEEALDYVLSLTEKYNMGIVDFQGERQVFAEGIEVLKYSTESMTDKYGDFEDIQELIMTIDSSKRGKDKTDYAFVTVWFELDGDEKKKEDFIQCTPNYKAKGFLQKIFSPDKTSQVDGYSFEVMKNGNLYQKNVANKEKLLEYFKQWCVEKKDIDTRGFKKQEF